MASRTRLRVSARTSGLLLMPLDTVLDETCARSATSWMVTDAGMGVMESGQTSLRRLGACLAPGYLIGSAAGGHGVRACRASASTCTSEIVTPNSPDASTANGTSTLERSAPVAATQDTGMTRVSHAPMRAARKVFVTSSIAPRSVAHRGSSHLIPTETAPAGA